MSEAEWRALLAEKEARIVQLEAIIEELRAALGLNSLNSSIAPSRDDSAARGKRRAKAAKHARRRKKEAQRQNRAKRSLLPPESVTSTEQHRPPACNACGEHLRARDMLSEPERVQKFELPEIRPLVHEIQVFSGKCRCCGEITKAVRPAEATTSKVGTRLRAFMMLLIGRFHLSRRDVVDFLGDVMQCDISLGLLSKIETQTAATLETAVGVYTVAGRSDGDGRTGSSVSQRNSKMLRPCARQEPTTVSIRSTNRRPRSDRVACDLRRHITAGRIARSARLFVGSTPSTRTNVKRCCLTFKMPFTNV